MSRINISINEKTESAAKEYADSVKLKFSNLVELALEDYLKARGYTKGDKLADFIDEIREMATQGYEVEKMREAIALTVMAAAGYYVEQKNVEPTTICETGK